MSHSVGDDTLTMLVQECKGMAVDADEFDELVEDELAD